MSIALFALLSTLAIALVGWLILGVKAAVAAGGLVQQLKAVAEAVVALTAELKAHIAETGRTLSQVAADLARRAEVDGNHEHRIGRLEEAVFPPRKD